MSWVKCLFLLNRYMGPAILVVNVIVISDTSVTDATCRNWFRLEGWGGLVVVVVVQIILVLRVIALYEKCIVVTRILVLGLCGHVAACATILGLGLPQIQPVRYLDSVPVGCITDMLPGFLFSLFVPHLIMETTLFSLTVIQSFKGLSNSNWESAPLLLLLLRDGTTYFFAMFAVTCTTAFTWLFAPPSLMKISIAPLIAISSVSGCRIIRNLRALHEANNNKVRVPELSLATFDLGDLEMRTLTLPRTMRSVPPTEFGSRTPQPPALLPDVPDSPSMKRPIQDGVVDVELALWDFKSRRSAATSDDGDDDDEHFYITMDRSVNYWSNRRSYQRSRPGSSGLQSDAKQKIARHGGAGHSRTRTTESVIPHLPSILPSLFSERPSSSQSLAEASRPPPGLTRDDL
ncbi:hypothetical protein FRB90_001589 [Tulasnella sp. 427]|nr:hypothetical protein FRB90_001589 [Tulasnella sp. 427]